MSGFVFVGFFLFFVVIAGFTDNKKTHGEENAGNDGEEDVHEIFTVV